MRKTTDKWILTIALSLCILGLLVVFSASTVTTASSPDFGYDAFFFLKRQSFAILAGIGLMMFMRRIDLVKLRQ